MLQAEEFDPFLDDMFQTADDNLMEEAETFLKSLQKKLNEQEGIYKEFKQKHTKWYKHFKEFHTEFTTFNVQVSNNLTQIKESPEILNLNLNLARITDKYFKGKKDLQVPDWFIASFFKEEAAKFRENLVFFSEKMKKARFTDDFCKNRSQLSKEVTEQLNKVMNIFVEENNIDSLYLLQVKDVIKGSSELKLYDQIVQDFLWQIVKKTVDYFNNVFLDFKTFKENSRNSLNKVKEVKFEGDESFLIQFNNIQKLNPQEVRIKRYDIQLNNKELTTLQEGICLNEKIPIFVVEYFKERNSKMDNEKFNKIFVNHANFFEKLMPLGFELDYNRIIYEDVKAYTDRHNGKNHTIFHSFDKILYLIDLHQNNWLIVEINNKTNKEIIIYDSNYGYSSSFHEKIIDIFRAYMVEELKNKGELNEEESLLFERDYVGRSAWCPQVSIEIDKGLFTVMNFKYLSEGGDLSSKNYKIEDVKKFRVDLFSLLMRIGYSKETVLNFELLL